MFEKKPKDSRTFGVDLRAGERIQTANRLITKWLTFFI
jgi:hypothetical protein